MIPYENYQLNSRQIERISRMKARERIQQYIKEYGHAPSQELISTFGAISADELEHYRRYHYSHNAEKENTGITATVEGWATQTQKTYDEFVRATYHLTDNQKNACLTLFRVQGSSKVSPFLILGFVTCNGEELDNDYIGYSGTNAPEGTHASYGIMTHYYNAGQMGVYTFNYLFKDTLSLQNYLFYGCKQLKEITIPTCVNTLGDYCFANCEGVETITCKAVNPPNISEHTFKNIRRNGVLYVPRQSVNDYVSKWSPLVDNGWIVKQIPGT